MLLVITLHDQYYTAPLHCIYLKKWKNAVKGDNKLTECSELIQPEQGKTASTAQRPRKQEDRVAGHLQEWVSHLANPQQSEHLGKNLIKLLKTAPRLQWSTKVL